MGWSAAYHVEEADGPVEERVDRNQRALADPVTLARVPQVLDNRVVADPENARDFPVGLSPRCPHHALALPVREPHWFLREAHPLHPSRRFEREGADELKKRQLFAGMLLAGFPGEGAGPMRFPRYMGGNCEALGDPVGSG